jgi:hypothetical protein
MKLGHLQENVLDRSGDYNVKGNKLNWERQKLHVLSYMQNLHRPQMNDMSIKQGLLGGGGTSCRGWENGWVWSELNMIGVLIHMYKIE